MQNVRRGGAIFLAGFAGYSLLELLWRGFTHWTMGVAGGASLLLLCRIERRCGEGRLLKKCLLGSAAITSVELTTGCAVNLLLHWDVWDYSDRRFNLLGQICPGYSALWFLLCVPVMQVAGRMRRRLS